MAPWGALALLVLVPIAGRPSEQQYHVPPPPIPQVIDAEPLPGVFVSPDTKWVLLMHLSNAPAIAELAEPKLVLARWHVNPRAHGADPFGRGTGFTLVRAADGRRWRVPAPERGLGSPLWSPDSHHFLFRHDAPGGIELWIADVEGATARRLTGPTVNTAHSTESYPPFAWLRDSRHVICQLVPNGLGSPPERPLAAPGPLVEETGARLEARVPTYGGNLRDSYDDALYDYYMTSQAVQVDTVTGEEKELGRPAIYNFINPSPDGRYLLTSRIVRPYSHLYTDDRFPTEISVLNLQGEVVRVLANLPAGSWGHTAVGWAPPGLRRFSWDPGERATISYIEALDGGDPRREVAFRDRLMLISSPFTGAPRELIRTLGRLPAYAETVRYTSIYGNVAWLKDGSAWVEEMDFSKQRKRHWLIDPGMRARPRLLRDWFSAEESYSGPGAPLLTSGRGGDAIYRGPEPAVLRQDGDWIYLVGKGGAAAGDRPFFDRFNLRTLKTQRLFQSGGESYEEVLAVLDSDGRKILTRRESPSDPPNYFVRDLRHDTRRAITDNSGPAVLARIRIETLHYKRDDGLPLSGELYLPADYAPGQRLPTVIWAYPLRYLSAKAAGEVRGSPLRYPWSVRPQLLLAVRLLAAQGYAVLWDAAMPVVGGADANDTAVAQLVANARAAVRKLSNMGVSDPKRVGIAGHSYGAVMTAVLLANSDLFAAGVAIDGVYNLTNTPLGFQDEPRSLWEAPDAYLQLSSVLKANNIKAPLLLVHGQEDDNWAAKPAESQLMFQALKGLGKSARLVIYPYEGHGPEARESVLDLSWEMLNWFDKHLKAYGAEAKTGSAGQVK